MPYDFDDLKHQDHLAPSDIRPPMNYAEGGMVTAPFTNVLNTQNQMNMMSRPTGSFSGMSSQINTNPPPAVMAQKQVSQGLPRYQPKSYQPDGMPGTPPPAPATQTVQRMNPYDQGAQLSQRPPESFPAQPFQNSQPLFPQPQQPQVVQVDETQQQQPPLAMAKGGSVSQGPERLIAQIRKKFAEQGIDFDKIMAMRLKHMGQKGDTMLAHINPEEAKLLKEHGGSGKTNPHTGLPSFGVDDGPEQGSTGSASGASYGGADTSSSDTSSSDTSSDTSTQAETPTRDRDSYGRESEPYTSPTSDATTATLNLQRAAFDAFDFSDQQAAKREAAFNAARIAAERESMQNYNNIMTTSPAQLMSDKMLQGALNLSAANQDILTAQKDEAARVKNYETLKSLGALQDTRPTEYEMSSIMSRKPATITGFESPTGIATTFNSGSSGIVPTGSFQKNEKSAFQSIVDAITSETVFPAPTASIYGYTPPSTKAGPVQAAPSGPTSDIYNYTPPASAAPLTTVNPMSPAAIQAAQQKSMANLAAAQAAAPANATFDEYNENPPANAPFPVPRPTEDIVTAEGQPATAPKATVSPIAQKMAEQEAARIAALEKDKRFVGGSRDQVAAALQVDPSQLKARIVLENGQPKVDYYTKSLGEVVGDALSSTGKFISGLTNPPVYNLPRGSYVRDPNAADFFSRTEEPRNYGPYGDLTREEYRSLYGGKDTIIPPLTTTTTDTTETKKPEETPVVAQPYRKRIYPTVQDLYNYGLTGGEYSFYDYPAAKKGGYISPLKAVKKNG